MDELWRFIEERCQTLGIDESHGLKHSKAVVQWAIQLIESEESLSEEERKMIIYAAALHDMCDSKYTDVEKSSQVIKSWLLEQDWSEDTASALVRIVTTMSYSKLKKAAETVGHRVWPDHGRWQLAYHITRHADLLDSYKVERCYQFQKHKFPEMGEEETWKIAQTLFENRVFRYMTDGWITLPKAVTIAVGLEGVTRDILKNRELTE